jgi:hypothetical protein
MSIAVRSLEASHAKYLRNCIRAYFEGQRGCDLPWIMSVIATTKVQARVIVEARFSQFAGTQAYGNLMAELVA